MCLWSASRGKWKLCFYRNECWKTAGETVGFDGQQTERETELRRVRTCSQADKHAGRRPDSRVETHRWSQTVPPNDHVTQTENKEGGSKRNIALNSQTPSHPLGPRFIFFIPCFFSNLHLWFSLCFYHPCIVTMSTGSVLSHSSLALIYLALLNVQTEHCWVFVWCFPPTCLIHGPSRLPH